MSEHRVSVFFFGVKCTIALYESIFSHRSAYLMDLLMIIFHNVRKCYWASMYSMEILFSGQNKWFCKRNWFSVPRLDVILEVYINETSDNTDDNYCLICNAFAEFFLIWPFSNLL